MYIFETHAHFDDEQFDNDRDELLNSLPAHAISPVINVGASMDSARASFDLAKKYLHVFAALGVHPSDIDTLDDEGMSWMRKAAGDPKAAAIGEIGLDYYWEKDEIQQKRQQQCFATQLELARDVDLPVIIHSRDACEDTLNILMDAIDKGTRGVMHCFSYSPEIAEKYVKKGFYLGIGGVVTFKNSKKLKETVTRFPLSCMVLETDCPYLAPEPFRGSRNDSTYLPYVVSAIAKLKQTTEEEVIEVTTANAKRLFSKAARFSPSGKKQ